MDRAAEPGQESLRSERLRLRPWRVADAAFHRALWAERDERVPPRRRITPDGRPTVAELEAWCLAYGQSPPPGLLVVEVLETDERIGYCGLIENSVGVPGEPELAFEFLRVAWNRGFATEASRAVIGRATSIGYEHLASTVREWNTASLRVLGKLGFVDTGVREEDAEHGDSLLLRLTLGHES
jgi:[ribosomal protein S5]-alanine N-acetyltransferase